MFHIYVVRKLILEKVFLADCKDSEETEPFMEFSLIPAGEFEMGSPSHEKRRKLWESPMHKVTIEKPFYLGRYPVTQEQWQKVMGDSPSYFKGENHPVENVSWIEVQAFLRKLNSLEKTENNCIYRLPTEAEWEY